MANNVLNYDLLETLNGAKAVDIDINTGYGNFVIVQIGDGEQVLAKGTLQYLEKQGSPNRSFNTNKDHPTLTLKAGGIERSRFRFPWGACIGKTEWQIHLNPTVSYEITAHSDGGNARLDLSGMTITGLSAETGGGNMDVLLPDNTANLVAAARTGGGNVNIVVGSGITGHNIVTATSGGGNVVVRLPEDVAARVHAATGMGKVNVDLRLSQIDKNIYQSADYDQAANKVEITVKSGAGNVSVNTK